MKRFFSIVLLVFLIFPYLGLFSWLHYQKSIVKKEVKNKVVSGLKKEELTLLKFTKKDIIKLDWEHSNEFEYNHQMYDVVSTELTSDSVFYYCWSDNEETILSEKIDQLLTEVLGNNSQKKDKCKTLVVFFKSLYFEEIRDFKVSFLSYTVSYKYYNNYYLSPFISSFGPPPKMLNLQ